MNVQSATFPQPSLCNYRELKATHQKVSNEQRAVANILATDAHHLDTAGGYGCPDDRFGTRDLKHYQPASDGLAWARDTALERPYSYLKLDTAAGRTPDSFVDQADLQAAASTEPMSLEQASEVLQRSFPTLDNLAGKGPGPDGLFGEADLMAAVFHPGSSPELRTASLAILGTPGAFGSLEIASGLANPDGLVGWEDLRAFDRGLKAADELNGYEEYNLRP